VSGRLANGLRVIALPQGHLERAHIALYSRVGSRFETETTNGLSHFLEHMIYRGTPRLPSAHAVNLAFEDLGGYLYAATHVDFGVFSVTLPEETFEVALPLFGEVLSSPAFFDIELERGIVREEILEDLDDEGREVNADNLTRKLIYPGHPLGFTITGSQPQVDTFSEEMLRQHHRAFYTRENSVLVLAGAVEPSRVIDLCQSAFESMPTGKRVAVLAPKHTQKKPRLRQLENASSQTDVRVCFRACAEYSPDAAVVELLMRVLDDGMSTRLYHRICNELGLCYDVSCGFDGYEDDGVIDFSAGVQHARTAKVVAEILELAAQLTREPPSIDELTRAQRRTAWDMRHMVNSEEEIGHHWGLGALFEREKSPEAILARSNAVTRDELLEVAKRYFTPERLNVVVVGLVPRDVAGDLKALLNDWKVA
jgi:predicted Zn-dependent peptidase